MINTNVFFDFTDFQVDVIPQIMAKSFLTGSGATVTTETLVSECT
jgi:hypothetical protein